MAGGADRDEARSKDGLSAIESMLCRTVCREDVAHPSSPSPSPRFAHFRRAHAIERPGTGGHRRAPDGPPGRHAWRAGDRGQHRRAEPVVFLSSSPSRIGSAAPPCPLQRHKQLLTWSHIRCSLLSSAISYSLVIVSALVRQASMHMPNRCSRRYFIWSTAPSARRGNRSSSVWFRGPRRRKKMASAGPAHAHTRSRCRFQPVRPPLSWWLPVEPRRGRPPLFRVFSFVDVSGFRNISWR